MSKTILITGATDGIGLETAKLLAAQGHHLILHGRNTKKIELLEKAILNISPDANIEHYLADLSSIKEAHALASSVISDHSSIDVLINNAGVFKLTKPITEAGLDARFVVNTISPFLLAKVLAPILGEHGRVVNLSSAAQQPVNLEAFVGVKHLADDMAAYAQSKLALIMWTNTLAENANASSPLYVSVNPGSLLASKMVREGFGVAGADLSIGAKVLCQAALSQEFSGASGQYYDNDRGGFCKPHPEALDKSKCTALVNTIESLIKKSGIFLQI